MFSTWAQGADPDPMAVPIELSGVSFVAFLFQSAAVPGGLGVDVQGLVVGCTGSDERARVVVEPLPRDASVLSVSALAEAVVALEAVELD